MPTGILSIDPGLSTGIALGQFDDETPYQLNEFYQVEGGLTGLLVWLNQHPVVLREEFILVCEKFQPLSHANYALTTASVEPLRIEGSLIALGLMPDYSKDEKRWLSPKNQYFVGGSDLKDKKKRSRAFLKDNGMHLTGSMVGCKNADDAISATLHGIAYAMKTLNHRPTFELVSNWKGNDNDA